jgi:hypothetical protein
MAFRSRGCGSAASCRETIAPALHPVTDTVQMMFRELYGASPRIHDTASDDLWLRSSRISGAPPLLETSKEMTLVAHAELRGL